ncbi:SfnB family sulfur acquisition oxidoreductase [Novosphingobium colocasiae]|uniref:SfnB family sulfur acquisition oxidoreductase n=1 Tax=Novosphingobium colocasiae TaxID=1256513 RepID=UPI0035B49DCA
MTQETALRSIAPAAHVIASDAEAIAIAERLSRRLAEGAAERDRTRAIPQEPLDWLSDAGLFGITVPREYGGADVSFETLTRVFQILSAGDAAIGQLPQNHFVFVDAIRQDGTEAQKAFFFAEVLAGARFGNAQAERGGSSALNLATRLSRAADGRLRLNGRKYYCTGALTAHWIPVAALDEAERLVLVYVRRDAPGLTVDADWNAMGQRTTYSGTTMLEEVAIEPSQVVEHWRLFERPSLFHSLGSLLHAAIDVGIAQDALAEGVALIRARQRPRLGAAVASAHEDPLLLHRLGQLSTRFQASEALLERAARALDAANAALDPQSAANAAIAVAQAKAFAEEASLEISSDIFALIGSAAADEALNLNRHWRNARTHTIHDANQWRYHAAGNWLLNATPPAKPRRGPAGE